MFKIEKNDENYIYLVISTNLKRLRKKKNITQEQLAEMSNYSPGFISNIESRKYLQTVSLGTLYRLALVLNTDIREFLKPIEDES